jgi:cysteine desulfurase
MRQVYLDNNSTTRIDPRVAEALEPYLHDIFGNPSNLHSYGRECAEGLAQARESVAALLGVEPDEIYFTGSGSESDNWAVKGVVAACGSDRPHIVASPVEHSAVIESVRYLESAGCPVTWLPVDGHGLVNPDDVRRAITPRTVLVTVMLANNEIGTVEPVAEIAGICRAAGILCHTDAVAACGKVGVSVPELGVDLLTISGHKLRAPKGVGVLYVRKGTKIHPLIHGGHQERGLRGGTENIIGIVGLGKAAGLLAREWQRDADRELQLRDRLEQAILSRIPEARINGHPTRRVPNVCHASFACIEGEALVMNLDLEGIAVATGSACSAGGTGPSPTLRAIGLPQLYLNSPVRFSLGPDTTEADIDHTMDVLETVVARLRAISPLWSRRPA